MPNPASVPLLHSTLGVGYRRNSHLGRWLAQATYHDDIEAYLPACFYRAYEVINIGQLPQTYSGLYLTSSDISLREGNTEGDTACCALAASLLVVTFGRLTRDW